MATDTATDETTDDASDETTDPARGTWSVRNAIRTGFRLAADLFVVTCWVLFLTLVFLEIAWPRWAFYVLLLGGVGVYVAVTATWGGGDST
ncbi:hypothetical protein RBH26_13255 [Natronolimnohabitans sp. A-GB9]|uniref:hypothetical protein n=1 Tax=Natronolimnohabitans sp. A-GB9 TaxID=3069757 RepID=UPI0027B0B454|nr:hypothetical protein [Natronolimnohabitans sp. A-GB9]MDQ2051445.1 hypothetical protein [Natronolimnohabitans sp. A-GB9]